MSTSWCLRRRRSLSSARRREPGGAARGRREQTARANAARRCSERKRCALDCSQDAGFSAPGAGTDRAKPGPMLPILRIAVTSPVTEHRALMGRVLASTRPDRGEGDAESFAPAWSDCALPITAARWAADDYDLLALDDEVWRCFGRHGRCELRIVDDGSDLDGLAERPPDRRAVSALRRLDEPGLGDAVLPADPRGARGDVRPPPSARGGRARSRARYVALGAAARAARQPFAAGGRALSRRRAARDRKDPAPSRSRRVRS